MKPTGSQDPVGNKERMNAMNRIQKAILIAILLAVAATYADILWHQNDRMYGKEQVHTLPTTRAIARMLKETDR